MLYKLWRDFLQLWLKIFQFRDSFTLDCISCGQTMRLHGNELELLATSSNLYLACCSHCRQYYVAMMPPETELAPGRRYPLETFKAESPRLASTVEEIQVWKDGLVKAVEQKVCADIVVAERYEVETGSCSFMCPHCNAGLKNPKGFPLERGQYTIVPCKYCHGPIFLMVLPRHHDCLRAMGLDPEIIGSSDFTFEEKEQYIWHTFQCFIEANGLLELFDQYVTDSGLKPDQLALPPVDQELIRAIHSLSRAPTKQEMDQTS